MSAPRIGVVGGGQLARMMQPAAVNLGIQLRVLAVSSDESAAQVIPDTVIGKHDNLAALREFAQGCDVITFDHEHVPLNHLQTLLAEGINIQPHPDALRFAQDKLLMRQALSEAGIPCPKWAHISDEDELNDFALQVGWPIVLKSARGGYDGKGVWVVNDSETARNVIADIQNHGQEVLAEECVPFTRELAAQVSRNAHGEFVSYPIVQSTQTDGICHEVIAPCPNLDEIRSEQAKEIAHRIATLLNVTGMLAVELFDTGSELLVNELAMRPHNSGHWSMDGAVTSQFENHLRAVLNLPLGASTPTQKWTVMVNLLGGKRQDPIEAFQHVMSEDAEIKIHFYGKSVKPGRKIGHVNLVGDNLDALLQRAWKASNYITGAIDE